MSSSWTSPKAWTIRRWLRVLFYIGAAAASPGAPAGVATESPAAPITDLASVIGMTAAEKSRAHPLRVEGRVSYVDPGFRIFWIERDHVGYYVQLAAKPPAFKIGQYVVIAGQLTPSKGLSADDVSVKVLEEDAPVTPLEARGRINDFTNLHARVVVLEGYVDSQQTVDDQHVRLMLIAEDRPVICWIKPDDPAKIPDWRGRMVRVTGVYSRRFNPTHTGGTIEMWLGKQQYLTVLGTLAASPVFNRPVTALDQLYLLPSGTDVLVRGTLQAQQIGTGLTLRDATGQVEVRSLQQQRMRLGTEVEAAGRVVSAAGQWVLDSAFYRPVRASAGAELPAADGVLRTVAEVRALGAGEAAQGRTVEITGMVTWSLPDADFLFLQDLTGGIRVYYDRARTGDIRYGKYFRIKGVTRAGRLTSAIELQDITDLGSMSHPRARPITLEQALTGREEGEWVELRGFLQGTESQGNWRWIHVTTPEGDFTGHLQNPENFEANPGSLIRIQGVCETTVDAGGRITGITLRVPFIHDITVEEDAPADYFGLARTPLGDLAALSTGSAMQRVKITGTVEHCVPGQLIYLEDEGRGLLLYTHDPQPRQPGERIEAVGILGREGARTLLRQALVRQIGTGAAPAAPRLDDPKKLVPEQDARLIRLRGTLIDVANFDPEGQTRLTLQQGSTLFDALLEHPAALDALRRNLGARLELTGIYQVKYDDARQAEDFQLLLRSPADIVVYEPARWWTLPRALAVAGFLGICVLLGLAWIESLRGQVRRQTVQIRGQMEHQARLEAEVQRATRLESLGILAGGLAHDFNNLLTIILGNVSLLKLAPPVMRAEGGQVLEIERGALRARDLTRQLLTFARGGDPLRTSTALPPVVRDAVELVLHGTAVRAAYEFSPDLWPANVDRDQIAQAVQNMMLNAVQAMPAGGVVRVALANAGTPPAGLAEGRYVRLTLADSGEGMAPEILPRIFDPYFSTRPSGGGLGLATVYSIVKKHGGRIQVDSHPGQGTVFTLWLPAAEAVTASPVEAAPTAPVPPPAAILPTAPAAPAAPLRVLMMDDEESIRLLASTVLHRMGLEPLAVADGTAALREFELARQAGRPFSLVILDLTIPGGMGGQAVIAAIRQLDANVPAIVSSGYSRDPVMANFQRHGFQAVVPKPYEISVLSDTVRRLLPAWTAVRPPE